MKKSNKRKETQSTFAFILDILICIYMVLILAVLPFYNEEGFGHIGTDKATFFSKCSVNMAKFVIPVLALYLVSAVITFVKSGRSSSKGRGFQKESFRPENIRKAVSSYLSCTDVFVLLYGVSVLLSYLCSGYREDALWGAAGWYMGLIPQLTLVTVYFLVSRIWTGRDWMTALILPVSAVVFLLGYLNRFGIYPVDMKMENELFISTIGNINWYCGYLVSVFFGGLAYYLETEWKKNWQGALMTLYVVIGFATLVTQGSVSGILTMAVMFLAYFWFSADDGKRMQRFWEAMVLFSGTCLVTCLIRVTGLGKITFIDPVTELLTNSILPVIMMIVSVIVLIGLYSGNKKGKYPEKIFRRTAGAASIGAAVLLAVYILLLIVNTASGQVLTNRMGLPEDNFLTFTPAWGSNRGATWRAGLMCFAEQNFLHKLTGVGPDCMSSFLYKDGSSEVLTIVRGRFGGSVLTNAHNEWLTVLVNMGLFGFVSYAGIMITAIARFIKSRKMCMIAGICGFCVLAYTVNNMFSFQQAVNVSTIFILLGIGENDMRRNEKKQGYGSL